jgi:putative Mg2+ transporter-C (MgtC) family protein
MHSIYDFLNSLGLETPGSIAPIMLRLVIAALLGGVIGLEREVKRKPAGLRTNMFICFGAAFFTVMSDIFAQKWGGDHTRIAAQIIPGIGFIGAGSILHSRGSVQGITTAATIFVVASVGMATGGGLYLLAVFGTLVIVVSLLLLGWLEARFNLKPLDVAYEVMADDAQAAIAAVNEALIEERRTMKRVQIVRADQGFRLLFTIEASQREQEGLLNRLRQLPALKDIRSLGSTADKD